MADSIINNFNKGLHQDSSFILQPDGTYRNMKNGMLISYDGNHYSIEMTKGNRVILTLNPVYLEENNSSASLRDMIPTTIGFISFIDDLIVFSTNNEVNGGYGEIGLIKFTRINDDFTASYTTLYNHKDLKFTKKHKIEGFSFRENDNIERVYWTDNFNEPRVFDVANPMFTTYIASGDIDITSTIPKKYMVLNGVVEYDGFWYGPSEVTLTPSGPNQINGNIFESDGSTNTYTIVSGTPLIIEYFPLELLSWTPNRNLGNIKFVEYGTGNKNCGNNIYFYRLSSTIDGISTSWSYPSTPIHTGVQNISSALSGVAYHDFVGGGSPTTLLSSGKSVKVEVSGIDTFFDTIELCCAEFSQSIDTPYQITIVNRMNITGNTMVIEDNGSNNFGTVTIDDLTTFPASILTCKTLTSNKNYSVIANTTERNEFELDLSGVTIGQVEYPLLAFKNSDSGQCGNGYVYIDPSDSVTSNPPFSYLWPNSRWLVTDDSGGNITYNSVSYGLGDVIVGVADLSVFLTATIPSGSQIRPCTYKNMYTPIGTSDKRLDVIQLKTGFWDYKDPAVASHNKGYWSDEKYRFGILFFDKKGNPYYVKWIGDYTFDNINDKDGLMQRVVTFTNNSHFLNPSGAKISGIDIPESVINEISGFSIVRAERDATIISQGLLMQTQHDPTIGVNTFYPISFNATDYSYYDPYFSTQGCLTSCICPDWQVGYLSVKYPSGFTKIGGKVKEASWLGIQAGSTKPMKSTTDYHNYLSYLFNHLPTDVNGIRNMTLSSMNGESVYSLNENGGISNVLGNNISYANFTKTNIATLNDATNTLIDYTCNAAGTPTYTSIDNVSYSIGCKKMIVTPTNFKHYNSSNDYCFGAEKFNHNKILVNFLTDTLPASQYGGLTPEAISNTLYVSTGHYQPITDIVKTETLNGTFSTGKYVGENKYTFNDIEVFGGDCFTNLIDIGWSIWDENYRTVNDSHAYALMFPCEGNVNYGLRRGLKVSNKGLFPNGNIAFYDASLSPTTQLESFDYNDAYSTDTSFIKYPGLPNNYRFTGKFEYIIRWSEPKIPGELNNSFRKFRIPDYRDIDGQRGQINNLKTRDSKVFYWQDHSVGYVPILERQLVGGSALGSATSLGVTGVVDRFDDIDTYFGNQHQHGLTETEFGFAWFDMRRRAFLVMGIGGQVDEISMINGLQTFFNSEFIEGLFPQDSYSRIYNTNSFNYLEVPLQGFGIVGGYDPKFKMTYLTFKYDYLNYPNYPLVFPLIRENKDFTLGYSHILKAFVSFCDNTPALWHNHNDILLTANNGKFTKYYGVNMSETDFEIGDTITYENVEYICISNCTYSDPIYPIESINFTQINKQNQIYIQTFGSDICKFYGKVWNHMMDVVVNFKTDKAVTPQNIQFKTIGNNWTSVECSTDDQTSQDLNITTTNRNYRWIDKSWFSSLPLPRNGRLTDYYVRIKFTFDNRAVKTNPINSKNIQKVSQWLKTFFIQKL